MRALGINIWHDGAAKASAHSGLTQLRWSGKSTAALLRVLRCGRGAASTRFVVGGSGRANRSCRPVPIGLLPRARLATPRRHGHMRRSVDRLAHRNGRARDRPRRGRPSDQTLGGSAQSHQDRFIGLLVARFRVDHVDGIAEGACAGRDAQPAAIDVTLDEPPRKIARGLVGE